MKRIDVLSNDDSDKSCNSNEGSDDGSDDMKPLLGNKNGPHNRRRQHPFCTSHSVGYVQRKRESKYRSVLLSFSLCFTLMGFWLLDSLKDSVFATLTQDLQKHQPLGKMMSVISILVIVCLMEVVFYEKSKKNKASKYVPASLIWNIALPYCFVFSLVCWALRKHPEYCSNDELSNSNENFWMALGYLIFVSIESFGSISVAAFWSFTNSNLDLECAKEHYGLIIAIGQLGAICGATIATHTGSISLSIPSLFLVTVMTIAANIILMKIYNKIFPLPLKFEEKDDDNVPSYPLSNNKETSATSSRVFMSGVYLILRHEYLLYILGVSCLYEVALTCLDYEFKLVSFAKFQSVNSTSITDIFAQFIGRYGQVINLFSFLLSFYGFPLLMRRIGLRLTLRVFPTLLVITTILAFVVPNIWVLFLSMALLKAMVYSIFDPAKEILYMPDRKSVV